MSNKDFIDRDYLADVIGRLRQDFSQFFAVAKSPAKAPQQPKPKRVMPEEEKRNHTASVRLTQEELRTFQDAAEARGLTLAEFMRGAALKRAENFKATDAAAKVLAATEMLLDAVKGL